MQNSGIPGCPNFHKQADSASHKDFDEPWHSGGAGVVVELGAGVGC